MNYKISSTVWIGAFWKTLSCACFAGVNGLVRYLSGGSPLLLETPLPIHVIMFFQNTIGSLLILPVLLHNRTLLKTILYPIHPILNIIRVVTAVSGIALWYVSLKYIPLTQVVALSFVAPFISLIGAKLFLNEVLNFTRLTAIMLSILGGFFITRPDLGLQNIDHIGWTAIFPLIATLVFTLDKLFTRKLLADGESATNVTLYLLVFMGPISLIPALHYGWIMPNATHWHWLLLLGLLAAGAHFSFSKAYAFAEVTFLMPFGIAKMLLCSVVGYLAFSEFPETTHMWIGIFVLTISTILLTFGNRLYKGKQNKVSLSNTTT